MMHNSLLHTHTTHTRFTQKKRKFTYPVTFFNIALDELPQLAKQMPGLTYNKPGLFSFYDNDYLTDAPGSIQEKLTTLIDTHAPGKRDNIQTFRFIAVPRFLRKNFSPIAFYYGLSKTGSTELIVIEVTNTYHEKHLYLLDALDNTHPTYFSCKAVKAMHVSPFLPNEGHYEFTFSKPEHPLSIHMTYKRNDETLFYANLIEKKASPLTSGNLIKHSLIAPFTISLILSRILWQAGKLMIVNQISAKRRPIPMHPQTIRPKPASPLEKLTQKALLAMLKNLSVGGLNIHLPDGNTAQFGDPTNAQTLHIRDHRFFSRIAKSGGIGFGESYMHGEWDTDDLTKLMAIIISNYDNLNLKNQGSQWGKKINFFKHLKKHNTLKQSKKNIQEHYDLGNDFYQLFLDESMMYSSGIFTNDNETLSEAQQNKIKHLADKLRLSPEHKVLEIGSGWGSMAIYIAQTYGCQVTTLTLSQAQHDYVTTRLKELGLTDKVQVKLEDYRAHQGHYDRLISIEMLEAVGQQYLPTYFKCLEEKLNPTGIAVIQTITIPDYRYAQYCKESDFIKKHIFPGGHLPSLTAISSALAEHTQLYIEHLENIGTDYGKTLARWHLNFLGNLDKIKALGFDDTFIRKWRYYFSYCEAAFTGQFLNDLQLVMTRPRNTTLHKKKEYACQTKSA